MHLLQHLRQPWQISCQLNFLKDAIFHPANLQKKQAKTLMQPSSGCDLEKRERFIAGKLPTFLQENIFPIYIITTKKSQLQQQLIR